MNETSWDTYQRIDRSDPELDALRNQLFIDLAPATYSAIGAAIQQRKIAKYLEARNHAKRIEDAAVTVAGEFTGGFQEAAA
jgi:hypothetical protein